MCRCVTLTSWGRGSVIRSGAHLIRPWLIFRQGRVVLRVPRLGESLAAQTGEGNGAGGVCSRKNSGLLWSGTLLDSWI